MRGCVYIYIYIYFYTYLEDIQENNRPSTLNPHLTHPLQQRFKLWLIPLNDPARAEEAHDAGRGAEAAEHEGDAGVLIDVGDGLAAGARGVDVCHARGREDAQR
jgi:hypothetical protein